MNENILRDILLEVHEIECGVSDDMPDFKPSLRHRLAMKRIFARFDRNTRKLRKNETTETTRAADYRPIRGLTRRMLITVIMIFLAMFLVGWVVIYDSKNFHGTVYPDNTQLTAKNLKEYPQTIEYKYALAAVPEGFEMIETDSSPIDVYTVYMNRTSQQTITLHQWIKSEFEPHYNTEHQSFEEVSINGSIGLCIDMSDDEHNHSLLVWDNGDFIIEIVADLDKIEMLNLSNIYKL